MITRIPVLGVRPQLEGGRCAKAVVGEQFDIRARIFGEGRLIIAAAAILTGPDGLDRPPVPLKDLGNDYWGAGVNADAVGPWTYRIESWSDPYAAWARDAPVMLEANIDVEPMLAEGATLLGRLAIEDTVFLQEHTIIADPSEPAIDRLVAGLSLSPFFEVAPLRDNVDCTDPLPVFVDRQRALVSAWYEFCPRSEGVRRADDGSVVAGTLASAADRLGAVADLGFDVICLPQLHPTAGGHDAVHPDLGTLADFDDFVICALEVGLEVAIELAFQPTSDHPWVTDIDPEALYAEIARDVRHWISHGVLIFRIDSPQATPMQVWERLLADIRETDPEVVFLAGTSQSPAMTHALAMVGFHQSHVADFAWHDDKGQAGRLLREIARESSDFLRPHLFVHGPGATTSQLGSGAAPAFRAHAVLAATASPSWGMHAGLDRHDWDEPESLAPFITKLNAIRRRHPALHQLRSFALQGTNHDTVLCFSKRADSDIVLVVVDLSPGESKSVRLTLDAGDIGLRWGDPFFLEDQLSGQSMTAEDIDLDPEHPARIFTVISS